MENIIIIGIVVCFGIVAVIIKIRDCGANPGYEEYLANDKAKYPEDYK